MKVWVAAVAVMFVLPLSCAAHKSGKQPDAHVSPEQDEDPSTRDDGIRSDKRDEAAQTEAETRSVTTGAVFSRDRSVPELGEAWRDPAGMIWGEISKDVMSEEDAEAYCTERGARLATFADGNRFVNYLTKRSMHHKVPGTSGSMIQQTFHSETLPNLNKEFLLKNVEYGFKTLTITNGEVSRNKWREDNRGLVRCVAGEQTDTIEHYRAKAKAYLPSSDKEKLESHIQSIGYERWSFRTLVDWALPVSEKQTFDFIDYFYWGLRQCAMRLELSANQRSGSVYRIIKPASLGYDIAVIPSGSDFFLRDVTHEADKVKLRFQDQSYNNLHAVCSVAITNPDDLRSTSFVHTIVERHTPGVNALLGWLFSSNRKEPTRDR